jgi:hypothetical protein
MPVARLLSADTSIGSPLYSIPMGLSLGIGCGVAFILLAWVLGQMPGIAVPIISSLWALLYYYSRGVSKVEGWANVAGIFATWGAYWTWYVT